MRATTPISDRRCSTAASKGGTQQRAAAPASPKRATTTSTSASNRPATATKTAAPPPPPPLASRLAAVALAATLALAPLSSLPSPAHARLEGVNKPELLPKEFTPVLDVAGFLTEGERARLRSQAEALEKDTGVKLRVLAQNYPETPGLAIKDYWGVDDDTVVFVVSARSFFSFFLSFFLSVHFLSLPLSLISHFSLSFSLAPKKRKTKNRPTRTRATSSTSTSAPASTSACPAPSGAGSPGNTARNPTGRRTGRPCLLSTPSAPSTSA